MPPPDVVQQHSLTHVPYQGWCDICVQAMGRDLPRRRVHFSEDELDVLGFDYTFMATQRVVEQVVPVLIP